MTCIAKNTAHLMISRVHCSWWGVSMCVPNFNFFLNVIMLWMIPEQGCLFFLIYYHYILYYILYIFFLKMLEVKSWY
uniref:Uncharacterized protein n=1 Tax=Mus musculus TaxID=10090 RepID=Q8CDA0_MOUSE|nr:unnamed protein product [Mus musculus]